ncbi:MAG: GtrA family protein [Nocardioides sp.]
MIRPSDTPPYLRRYVVVGIANTCIDLGLFALLHGALGITLANFVSTSCGMTFSFLVNGRWTFGHQRRTVRQAALFLATTGGSLWVAQPLVIHGLVALLGDHYVLAAKVVAIGVAIVLNFLGYRFVVWRPTTSGRPVDPDEARAATRR